MRLIDADALISKIEKRYIDACIQVKTRRSGKGVQCGIALGMNRARNEISEQPTIDAVPVRHGRWRVVNVPKKWGGATLRCSECNTGTGKDWNYCPNCGAKMDLKEE